MSESIIATDIYNLIRKVYYRCQECGTPLYLDDWKDGWFECENCGSVYWIKTHKIYGEDTYIEQLETRGLS